MGAAVLRGSVVLGLLGSAWVHGDLWLQGYRDIDIIGPLFMVNVLTGVLIAVAVFGWRHWLPPLLAVGFGAATLGAFVLSATVGLFGMSGQVWGAPQVWGVVTEVVCILGGGLLLVRDRRLPRGKRSRAHEIDS